jgi:hypothetical protein
VDFRKEQHIHAEWRKFGEEEKKTKMRKGFSGMKIQIFFLNYHSISFSLLYEYTVFLTSVHHVSMNSLQWLFLENFIFWICSLSFSLLYWLEILGRDFETFSSKNSSKLKKFYQMRGILTPKLPLNAPPLSHKNCSGSIIARILVI